MKVQQSSLVALKAVWKVEKTTLETQTAERDRKNRRDDGIS